MDEAGQLVFDLDFLKGAPVTGIGAFQCRVDDTLDRELHILCRHLAETVGEADIVLQREGDRQIVELLDAADREGVPAPDVTGFGVHQRREDGADDILFRQGQPECRVEHLKVRIGPYGQDLAVLAHRHSRHGHAGRAKSACSGQE